MSANTIFLESDERWSVPAIRSFSAANYAAVAIGPARTTWDDHDTSGAVQQRIGNCILRSARKMFEQTGCVFEQCYGFRILTFASVHYCTRRQEKKCQKSHFS